MESEGRERQMKKKRVKHWGKRTHTVSGKGIILMIFYYSILGFLNLPVTDDFHIFLYKIMDEIYTGLSLGSF